MILSFPWAPFFFYTHSTRLPTPNEKEPYEVAIWFGETTGGSSAVPKYTVYVMLSDPFRSPPFHPRIGCTETLVSVSRGLGLFGVSGGVLGNRIVKALLLT